MAGPRLGTRAAETAGADVPAALRAGDRLDQPRYHDLYRGMPDGFRAELIGGLVIVPQPVSDEHGESHASVAGWLWAYRAATPGTRLLDNPTLILGPRSEPQPDLALLIEPECGGATRLEGSYRAGPPELVVEVAITTAAIDRGEKYRDYEEAGVQEYLIVAPREAKVEWFVRRSGRFAPLLPDGEGLLRSPTFPGLWLDAVALGRADAARMLEVLRWGLGSPEHAAFEAKLHARRGG